MVVVSKEIIGGLFDSYSDMVYRIALNIVRNREEAQDIVMDVFMSLMKQNAFNDELHIKRWLIRAAENRAINVVKSARVSRTAPLDELLQNTLSAPLSENEYDVLNMVMRLPDKLKTTVYMFYYEDMSAEEIARALGISVNAVYKRLERGRSALKISLEGEAI